MIPDSIKEAIRYVRGDRSYSEQEQGELLLRLQYCLDSLVPRLQAVQEDETLPLEIKLHLAETCGRRRSSYEGPPRGGAQRASTDLSRDGQRCVTELQVSWDFDAAAIAKATEGRPLSTFAMAVFEGGPILSRVSVDRRKLDAFLKRAEAGYGPQPYHNAMHAASVLHVVHMVLQQCGALQQVAVDEHDGAVILLAAYLAAILHDYRHFGLTAAFLHDTDHDIIVRFNHISPLEQFHVHGGLELLRHPECNFLHREPAPLQRRVQRLVAELILGTDMAQHEAVMAKINVVSALKGPVDLSDQETVSILQLVLKCADLGHAACEWDHHKAWVNGLSEELYRQGDVEKLRGMAVSPLMDRDKPGIESSQVGFFRYVLVPMFTSLAIRFPNTLPLVHRAQANLQRWQEYKPPPVPASKRVKTGFV